jgi:hypothetical protein
MLTFLFRTNRIKFLIKNVLIVNILF